MKGWDHVSHSMEPDRKNDHLKGRAIDKNPGKTGSGKRPKNKLEKAGGGRVIVPTWPYHGYSSLASIFPMALSPSLIHPSAMADG
jgi:hypothetical protein